MCQVCQFMDDEAEVSEAGVSSDEDETDLDGLDGSFIDDATQALAAPGQYCYCFTPRRHSHRRG